MKTEKRKNANAKSIEPAWISVVISAALAVMSFQDKYCSGTTAPELSRATGTVQQTPESRRSTTQKLPPELVERKNPEDRAEVGSFEVSSMMAGPRSIIILIVIWVGDRTGFTEPVRFVVGEDTDVAWQSGAAGLELQTDEDVRTTTTVKNGKTGEQTRVPQTREPVRHPQTAPRELEKREPAPREEKVPHKVKVTPPTTTTFPQENVKDMPADTTCVRRSLFEHCGR